MTTFGPRTRSRSSHAAPLAGTNLYVVWTADPLYRETTRTTGVSSVIPYSLNDTMSDVVTAKFKEMSGSGVIINNPFTLHRIEEFKSAPCACAYSNVTYIGYRGSTWTHGVSNTGNYRRTEADSILATTGTVPSNLRDLATTRLFANISNAETLALASLYEAEETLKMIVTLLRDAIKIFRAVRSYDAWALRREFTPKQIRNKYLGYRYGLRPLAFDISNIINAYNASLKKRRRKFNGHARYSLNDNDHYHVSGSYWTHRFDRITTLEAVARAGAVVDVAPTYLDVWGLNSIAETAWEIVPFSFIIDWFINVGDTIASWSPKCGCEVIASWVTLETTLTQRSSYTSTEQTYFDPLDISVNWNQGPTWYKKITTDKVRTPNPSRPVFPQFSVNLDAMKILDLASILSQFRR